MTQQVPIRFDLGREEGHDIVLEDGTVSREQHALFKALFGSDGVLLILSVKDNQSTNGTYLIYPEGRSKRLPVDVWTEISGRDVRSSRFQFGTCVVEGSVVLNVAAALWTAQYGTAVGCGVGETDAGARVQPKRPKSVLIRDPENGQWR